MCPKDRLLYQGMGMYGDNYMVNILMYKYSLQINQHLKLKRIISKAGQIFVKIHPFIIF